MGLFPSKEENKKINESFVNEVKTSLTNFNKLDDEQGNTLTEKDQRQIQYILADIKWLLEKIESGAENAYSTSIYILIRGKMDNLDLYRRLMEKSSKR